MKNNTVKKNTELNLSFKKVMRGFDPEEVTAYITEMSRTMQNASKIYETRMSEIKQELTLVNRERDNLRAQCEELKKSISESTAEPVPAITPESVENDNQAIIDELEQKLNEKSSSEAYSQNELQNAGLQIAQLSAQVEDKEKELLSCQERIALLESQINKQDSVQEQYEDSLACIENLKSRVLELESEKERLIAEAENAEANFRKTFDETGKIKTELTRITVENSLLSEKNEQYKAEISELKSEAKNKAYEFAEKLSAEEDELNKEKIRLQKKLQLQNYHIEQAKAAIDELTKQIEQIRVSFSD